jgi:hypothetical protein
LKEPSISALGKAMENGPILFASVPGFQKKSRIL